MFVDFMNASNILHIFTLIFLWFLFFIVLTRAFCCNVEIAQPKRVYSTFWITYKQILVRMVAFVFRIKFTPLVLKHAH